jgi:hypothetical protein
MQQIFTYALMLVSAFLSFRHGWESLNIKAHPESARMMSSLGITETIAPALGVFTLIVGCLILIPRTFFIGNLLNALSIVAIMALALRGGNYKIALIEIPFLILPLLLIYLGHPMKK